MSDISDEEPVQGYYVQRLTTLDLAWDRLHEEEVRPVPPFKTISQTMAGRVDPADISHIIDVAITAWRWRGVPSGRFKCGYCGDETDQYEDPDPMLCRMCAKIANRT